MRRVGDDESGSMKKPREYSYAATKDRGGSDRAVIEITLRQGRNLSRMR